MTTTQPPTSSVEDLLDRAWTLDCAIRLGEAGWAEASAQCLADQLARHERETARTWRVLRGAALESEAAHAETVRTGLRSLAAELRGDPGRTRPDIRARVERLIHEEAVAVGDIAWRVVD